MMQILKTLYFLDLTIDLTGYNTYTPYIFHNYAKCYKLDIFRSYNWPYRILYMHHPHSILMLNFTILIFFRSYNLPYTLFTFHNDAKFYKLDIVKSYNCPYRIVYTHHPHSIMMPHFKILICFDLTIDHTGYNTRTIHIP